MRRQGILARVVWILAGLLLAGILWSACASRQLHRGHKLVMRRCTACHSEPERDMLEDLDLSALSEVHAEKMKLTDEELALIREYGAEGDPEGED